MKKLIRRYLLRDPFEREIQRWFKDRGDSELRMDYPLSRDSVVLDVGGYVGDFAADLVEKYDCQVFVFEPHPVFFQKCVARFRGVENVRLFNFGLSSEDGEFVLSDAADGSSFENNRYGHTGPTCKVRKFSSVVKELDLGAIALMKINIEGGEFPLLQHILAEDLAISIEDFQIQFHNFIEKAPEMRSEIQSKLSLTHVQSWNYEFVWENWRLRRA